MWNRGMASIVSEMSFRGIRSIRRKVSHGSRVEFGCVTSICGMFSRGSSGALGSVTASLFGCVR